MHWLYAKVSKLQCLLYYSWIKTQYVHVLHLVMKPLVMMLPNISLPKIFPEVVKPSSYHHYTARSLVVKCTLEVSILHCMKVIVKPLRKQLISVTSNWCPSVLLSQFLLSEVKKYTKESGITCRNKCLKYQLHNKTFFKNPVFLVDKARFAQRKISGAIVHVVGIIEMWILLLSNTCDHIIIFASSTCICRVKDRINTVSLPFTNTRQSRGSYIYTWLCFGEACRQ